MRTNAVIVDGVKFVLTEFSSYGFGVGVQQWRKQFDKDHFIIKTVGRPFDKNLFSFPHTPILIDEVASQFKFSRRSNLKVLDMPIKFPGSMAYSMPREVHQFDEVIAKIISFEHNINKNVLNYYAYLTIDQEKIEPGNYQRRPGCHVDGFQGARIKEKRPVCRSYIAYDCIPTSFYPQSFKTDHLNEETDNFFSSFDEQSDPEVEITFSPLNIILMNSYTVHRANIATEPVYRTFIRVSYDTIVYDRFGNTHNPMFSYRWPMMTRNTQSHLKHKPLPKIEHHPDAF